MIFCGAGLVALPLDMIREFLGRPKTTIPKSEYMTRAKALGNKAKGIMVLPLLPDNVFAATRWLLLRLLPADEVMTYCLQHAMAASASLSHGM